MKEITETKHVFWPYDVFGYLLPGAIVLSAIVTLDSPIRERVYELFSSGSWFHVIVLVVFSYITGHIVASLSSFLIERCYLKLFYGYPAAQFLDEQTLIRKFVQNTINNPWLNLLRYPIRCIFPGYCEAWSEKYRTVLIQFYTKSIAKGTDIQIEGSSSNVFWSANVYVAEHSAFAFKYASHFVELYGFSRNASCGFLILAMLTFSRGWNLIVNGSVVVPNMCLGFFCIISGYLLLHNYTKLFRRHNDQMLRSFMVAVCKVEEDKDTIKDDE